MATVFVPPCSPFTFPPLFLNENRCCITKEAKFLARIHIARFDAVAPPFDGQNSPWIVAQNQRKLETCL